jgi:hypothetical protein
VAMTSNSLFENYKLFLSPESLHFFRLIWFKNVEHIFSIGILASILRASAFNLMLCENILEGCNISPDLITRFLKFHSLFNFVDFFTMLSDCLDEQSLF